MFKKGPFVVESFTNIGPFDYDCNHYSDPLWGVTLYYFLGVCMFECIPPQTFQKNFIIFLHIMLKYNISKILEKNYFISFYKVGDWSLFM
jgi:hypothetical protein